MIDPKKMMDDFEAQDRYIVSLQSENDRLRNDITLRDGVIAAKAVEVERLEARVAELNMLSFKWMDAHDKLAAGKEYRCPSPVDLPDALAEVERLRNDMKLRNGVIRDLEEKRVELNAEIGRRDDQIRALQAKVHLCVGYDKMRKALERITNMPNRRGATGDAEKGYAEALHDCGAIAEQALQDTEDESDTATPTLPPGYAHLPAGYVAMAYSCLNDAKFHPAYRTFDHKARRVIETARDLLDHCRHSGI